MNPEYRLVFSNRKSLSIEITRELEVIVRAPRRCPKREIERFVSAHEAWLSEHLERQRLRSEAHPKPSPEERLAFIDRALAEIPPLVSRFAQSMGLCPVGIKITSAEKRFGSCSAKNSLCFSWRLMDYPQAAIEYVVVHELAHIVHKNHGREFYALIATVLPDYKAREKLLRR
ncbi:MAG: YgjP-like metallopeptidase domain-containing protein [Oscillospiraceae bacterium]